MKSVFLILCFGAIIVAGFITAFSQNITDEARKHFNRGMAAVELAKSQDDWESAIEEFTAAKRLAPDWADVYFNIGTIQEKIGKYDEAIVNLKQYLKLAPNAEDATAVKDLIDKIEYKAERKRKDDERVNRVVGSWYSPTVGGGRPFTFYLKDGKITLQVLNNEELLSSVSFDGENLLAKWVQRSAFDVEYQLELQLGPDGTMRGSFGSRLLRAPASWRGRPVGVFTAVEVELAKR